MTDYKSGTARDYEKIETSADPTLGGTKLQLPVYGHAARLRTGRPDAQVRAEYWFIGPRDRGRRISVPLEAVQQRFTDVVDTIADGIAGGLFPAVPPPDRPWSDYGPGCSFCDPDGLGAAERRAQWERKQADPVLRSYLRLANPSRADELEAVP